jgi:hypothetical protein
MLKILYAAQNNVNSKIQLTRFLNAMCGTQHRIKIAAYKISSPQNVSIDWTLDCLQNMFKPEHVTLDNDNFITYYNQVKHYNPDLIISDMEYYTSEIANTLGTALWQCSSSMINFALTNEYKYNLGIFKRYAFLFNRNPLHSQRMINIQDNSNCNYVYSHFGDCQSPPSLKEGYEWIRPYHQVGKIRVPCQHNVVGGILGSNKPLISLLKRHADSVCFTDFQGETYANPMVKDIRNQEEYFCNLRNSNLFACAGQTSFLADAFYNSKHSVVLVNLEDPECVINSTISEKLGLSTSIYQPQEELPLAQPFEIVPSERIKFLHERIEEL